MSQAHIGTATDALTHRLVAGYNGLLAVIWAAHGTAGPHAVGLAAAHTLATALPWLVARAPQRGWGLPAALGQVYPLVFVMAFWIELDLAREAIGVYGFDGTIAGLDRAIFGRHIHEIWMPRMDRVWFSELMFFLYYAYFGLVFLPPLIVAIRGRQAALEDITRGLTATYLSCFVVYLAFPVYGPHFLMDPHAGPHTEGLFYRLVAAAQAAGDSRGCAFPSSHVAGAVTVAVLGWHWFSRPVAIILSLGATGVLLSTVYTQNHYAIDAAAGAAWALVLQYGLAARRVGALLRVSPRRMVSPS